MIRIGISGIIAYEAASRLLKENRGKLEEHFSQRFLHAFDGMKEEVISDKNAENITKEETGGVFGTVWRALEILERSEDLPFAVKAPAGCRIDLQQIPVRQEIIEICELFDENPYEADSAGAYLVIWDEDLPDDANAVWFHTGDPDGDIYTKPYPQKQIVSIGYITCSKDRLIINGDMVRYLTPHDRQMTDIIARKNDRRFTDE